MTTALPPVAITATSLLWAGGHDVVLDLAAPPNGEPPWTRVGLTAARPPLVTPTYVGRVDSPLPALPKELLGYSSRSTRLLVAALLPLVPHIERARERVGKERIAVVLGSSTGGIDATEYALRAERAHGKKPDDFVFEQAHVYYALVRVTEHLLGVAGPSYVISTACSSGAKALAAAQRLLAADLADVVIAGGVDALSGMTVEGFASLGILSPAPARPFDGARAGLSIGEGAALLVVEREGASPYVLLGAGESGDAYHTTAPHPDGLGARLAIHRALAAASLTPADVAYVNAHGTGTEQNDAMESSAISAELGAVRFSSTKDRTGHQLGTAGATEAIFCLEALRRGELPQNLAPERVDRALVAQPIIESSRLEPSAQAVLSNSFAFGGSNVCLALGRNVGARGAFTERTEKSARPAAPRELVIRDAVAWAPGHPNLTALLDVRAELLADAAPPAAALLPPRVRGRGSVLVRLFAELFEQLAGPADRPRFDTANVPLITGSAYGEMAATSFLLDQLVAGETLSPARFQASVHNTALGQLSLVTENRAFGTATAAGDATLATAFLEAAGWLAAAGGEVVVLVADEAGIARLLDGPAFPALGVGFRLAIAAPEQDGARITLPARANERREGTGREGGQPAPLIDSPHFGALELARALARGRDGVVPLGEGYSVVTSRAAAFRE